MIKWKNIAFLGLSGLVLGACSAETDADTTPNAEEQSSVVVTSESEKVTESKKADTGSAVGKRSNPAPLNEPQEMEVRYYDNDSEGIDGKVMITVSNVMRGEEAYNQLIEENEFNDAAPEGHEWVIFDVKMTLEEGSMDDPFNTSMISITPISSDGSEVPQNTYATFADGTDFGWKDIYEGGTDSGKVGKIIPINDETTIEISDMQNSIFFTLQ